MKFRNIILTFTIISLVVLSTYKLFKKENSVIETETTTIIKSDAAEKDLEFSTTVIIDNLEKPWDIEFLPNNKLIITEKINRLSIIESGKKTEIETPDDVFVNGEGGLLGFTLDPDYINNNLIYLCFNSKTENNPAKILVSRFKLNEEEQQLENRVDIIDNIVANESGRHSGCRLEFGPEEYLWVGTGDAAMQNEPQDPKTLGGKILKVDRDGNPAPDNIGGNFDPRIYSYGHRNTQGLSFFRNDEYKNLLGISIEHGPDRDDEVNLLKKGNFGWDPLPYYGEAVPMTDLKKFPEAIEALWSSGFPTTATSGGTIINSEKWGEWTNSIAVANLKGSHLLIMKISPDGELVDTEMLFHNKYGRLRTIQESPEGDLYILTDNGYNQDQIIKLEVL